MSGVAALAALAAVAAVYAQPQTAAKVVVCYASVIDKAGHLVTGLPKSAFHVTEDGTPLEIKVFKAEDIPVAMGLVIDNSGSMRDKRARVEAAALALVKDSNPEDEVFVVNFNDEAFLDLPPGMNFTHDIDVLKHALERIDSRGGTAMRDAIAHSIEYLKEHASRDKKVLVVVTDGNDNSSLITLENVVEASQQAGILIYSVGLLTGEGPHAAREARKALNTLAESTGASAFFPKGLAEVDRIAHQVADDIRNQYTIEYTPANTSMDGELRAIKISVNAPGKPTVRTRPGCRAADSTVRRGR